MVPFLPEKVHSCSTSAANTYICVIKLVNQLPIHHNSQLASWADRQAVSRLGQTREQLAATFNSLRLPGLASAANNRNIPAKCCMWWDGWTGCTQRVKRRKGRSTQTAAAPRGQPRQTFGWVSLKALQLSLHHSGSGVMRLERFNGTNKA